MLYLIQNDDGDLRMPSNIWNNILEYTIPPKKPDAPHPCSVEINYLKNTYLLTALEYGWDDSLEQFNEVGADEFINLWAEHKVADFDDWGSIALNLLMEIKNIKEGYYD